MAAYDEISKKTSVVDMASPNKDVEEGYRHQDVEMYNWSRVKTGGCLNFVLKLVLVGALGSFLFGFNIALLNTAVSAVFSDYQQCGRSSPVFDIIDTVEKCEALGPTGPCMTQCKLERDESQKLTGFKCPGGYNDVSCDSLKWFNAILSCAILIGAAVGSMTGGNFLSFGRRLVLLVCMFIFVFGVVSSVVANSFSALLWARLVVGYAVGLVSVASPTYMAEVTPANKRGTYGVFHQLFIVIGILLAVLIGLALENPAEQNDQWVPSTFQRFWWRFMLGLGILPVLLGIYLLLQVYSFETPHYYVEQRRFQDAAALLQRIHGREDVNEELNAIIDNIRNGEVSRKNGLTYANALSNPKYRRVIFVGLAISAFQQLGGINVFMTSSNDLFKKAGLDGTMQTVMSTLMAFLNCVMTFPTLYLVERVGRRSLLLVGSLGQFLFVVPAAIMYWTEADPLNPKEVTQILAIVGVLGFVTCFALAYGPVLWVYLFEIYPMEIKEVAAGAATGANWIAGIVMVFSAVVLPNQISYTLFAGLQLVGTLIIFFFMKETKGRTLGDSPYM